MESHNAASIPHHLRRCVGDAVRGSCGEGASVFFFNSEFRLSASITAKIHAIFSGKQLQYHTKFTGPSSSAHLFEEDPKRGNGHEYGHNARGHGLASPR